VPDVRVLAGIAQEMGKPLGFQTVEGAAAELAELGVWDGARVEVATGGEVSTGSTDGGASTGSTDGGASTGSSADGDGYVLATWKTMIGNGPMQDGDPAYHASGPTPALLVSEATLAALGVEPGQPVQLSSPRGSAVLPVEVADLDDHVVWAPANSGGVNLARDLGVLAGSRVSLAAVQAPVLAKGESR
jgi:NADH-quinone oxidoreductase subunit G